MVIGHRGIYCNHNTITALHHYNTYMMYRTCFKKVGN